jgi:uncharacterized protein YbgA (DUF1722 family)
MAKHIGIGILVDHYVLKHKQPYLAEQTCLNPFPWKLI